MDKSTTTTTPKFDPGVKAGYRNRDYDAPDPATEIAHYLKQFSNPAATARSAWEHILRHGLADIRESCAALIVSNVPYSIGWSSVNTSGTTNSGPPSEFFFSDPERSIGSSTILLIGWEIGRGEALSYFCPSGLDPVEFVKLNMDRYPKLKVVWSK